MYLLKHCGIPIKEIKKGYLHSTMYLLKRFSDCRITRQQANLHSTMYLLKRRKICQIMQHSQFTFHYVSIKTKWTISQKTH